jgi:D-sedoheptulose 7-phosphate isomerase
MSRPEGDVDTTALDALGREHPELLPALGPLAEAARILTIASAGGGTIFLTGNGGSMADALHIAGELRKSFERPRPLPLQLRARLAEIEGAEALAEHLEAGLRVLVLGADPVLSTAVDNDIGARHMGFAQELVSLGRPGDALLAVSTSGRSANVTYAALAARALDMRTVVLTGNGPATPLTDGADLVVRVPATATAEVQGLHGLVYHALCRVLEDTFFPTPGPA